VEIFKELTMRDRVFDILQVFNEGSNCKDPKYVKDLWMLGRGLYFLEFGEGDSSGEFCFDYQMWDQSRSRFAAFCTQVPGGGDMALMYIPSGIERITSENVMEIVRHHFVPSDQTARFLKKPCSLNANAYPSIIWVFSLSVSHPDESRLKFAEA